VSDEIPRIQRLPIDSESAGLRLDQFLAARGTGLSRTRARKLIEIGGVHLDGRRTRRCGEAVREGSIAVVHYDGGPLDPFRLTDDHILYRDKFVLAVAKPAGVDTQPTPARYQGTLYAALLTYLRDPWRPLDRPALGMVQRLDRDTSGVMVFSIHPRAHRGLTRAFAERRVDKIYLALVHGRIDDDQGEFSSRLARSRKGNRMRSVEGGGREAVTRFRRVMERFADATLVEVEILTGRTHQIRVHFSEAGHPLLGDLRYGKGDGETSCPRQMLHAARLAFPHPVSGEPLVIEAPVPIDMRRVLEGMRGDFGF
jgi:23S rRNA pseudouridine1911/1915/1917 synthase